MLKLKSSYVNITMKGRITGSFQNCLVEKKEEAIALFVMNGLDHQ